MNQDSEIQKLEAATKQLERAVEARCLEILNGVAESRTEKRRVEQLAEWRVWVGAAPQVQHGSASDPKTSLISQSQTKSQSFSLNQNSSQISQVESHQSSSPTLSGLKEAIN